MIKAFIDTSVFFSACYSEAGASFEIFRQALQGNVQLVISDYVLQEVQRNLAQKSAESLDWFEVFLANIDFELVSPNREEVLDAARYTHLKDAPVVAAARRASVDYLISLDRRHLVGRPEVTAGSGLQIVLPEDFLRQIRHSNASS